MGQGCKDPRIIPGRFHSNSLMYAAALFALFALLACSTNGMIEHGCAAVEVHVVVVDGSSYAADPYTFLHPRGSWHARGGHGKAC